jgi:integrase
MARRATGGIVRRQGKQGTTYQLRFNAHGRRQHLTLGSTGDGWTRARAEAELGNVIADVRRGIWTPPEPEPAPVVEQDPTFHEFSSDWFDASKGEWRPKTRLDYEWQLSHHLLPFFRHHRLSQITIAEVDRYRAHKVTGTLSATSINKTITRLGQVLEVAVEYGLIDRNPAKGKRRRLKATKPAPVWLDSAEQITALLDAAGALDQHAKVHGGHDQKGGPVYRRALLATFAFAGLRIGELIALRWRDVDLAAGRITVRASKTDAGVRQIDLLPVLRDELAEHKARAGSRAKPDGFVFATLDGSEQKGDNIRKRVLGKAVDAANATLAKADRVPLPDGLTPHKLRHTFASILVALGVDPGSVMDQLGHTDPGFTLRVYRHGMRRDDGSRAALRELVGAPEVVQKGANGVSEGAPPLESSVAGGVETTT